MSELMTPYHVDESWYNDDCVELVTVCDTNGVFVFTAFADDADEILKRINGYEQLEQSNKELLEALKLAREWLSGWQSASRQLAIMDEAITNAEREG